jgi:hypothetical protein
MTTTIISISVHFHKQEIESLINTSRNSDIQAGSIIKAGMNIALP